MISQIDEFSGILPSNILRRAYNSGNELAWSRADAIAAIDTLVAAGFEILGVDVWIPSSPGPRMTGWDWSVNDTTSPGAPRSARDFVASFKWGPDDGAMKAEVPYFNLTTSEKQVS